MANSAKRKFVYGQVISWFSDHFHLPAKYFGDKTDLRTELLFADASLVELGKYFNKADWTTAKLYPWQYAACKTIGDLVDLIAENSQ